MTADNDKVIFTRLDGLRDELNEQYKRVADVDARVASQERMMQQVMCTMADHRSEMKREMADLKTDLGRQVNEVLNVTQLIHRELKETREKHERELVTVRERHEAVIDVVKADVAHVKNQQAETNGGIKTARWLVETLKVTAVGGTTAVATWAALGTPGA